MGQEAFGHWAALTGTERSLILTRAAQALKEAQPEMARLEVTTLHPEPRQPQIGRVEVTAVDRGYQCCYQLEG